MKLTINNLKTADGQFVNLTVDFADPNQRNAIKALANNPDALKCIMSNLANYETYAEDASLEVSEGTKSLLREIMR